MKILLTVSWRASATPLPVGVLEASSGLCVGLSHVEPERATLKEEWSGSSQAEDPPLVPSLLGFKRGMILVPGKLLT